MPLQPLPPRLYLSENAFLGVVLAAVEVFNKECLGILTGYRSGGTGVVVQRAVALQSAARTPGEVRPNIAARRRVSQALASLSTLERPLGWFHSHPNQRLEPALHHLSAADGDSLDVGEMELVAAIWPRRRSQVWSYNPRTHTLAGSLGDHNLKLTAWLKTDAGRRPTALEIYCPFAHGYEELTGSAG
jgi:proteasome lid subunit RPN8/RPN11